MTKTMTTMRNMNVRITPTISRHSDHWDRLGFTDGCRECERIIAWRIEYRTEVRAAQERAGNTTTTRLMREKPRTK